MQKNYLQKYLYSINELHKECKKLQEKVSLKNEAPQNTDQNSNMHPTLLSESKTSNPPPQRPETQCMFLSYIIPVLLSIILFFSPR